MQVKLIQSEQQLATLKASLSNGPSMELIDSPVHSDFSPSECGGGSECGGKRECEDRVSVGERGSECGTFSAGAVVERVTCKLQIPKGHNPRKQGWRDVVSREIMSL